MATRIKAASIQSVRQSRSQDRLQRSYDRFVDESDPARKNKAAIELIRVIFGKDAVLNTEV